MYTKEEFRENAKEDMRELFGFWDEDKTYNSPDINFNGHNYCFSESENKIILRFAVNYEMDKIGELKRKYEAKYGEQILFSIKQRGTLNEVAFEFTYCPER